MEQSEAFADKYLAYLDVLGFTDLVYKDPQGFEQNFNEYIGIIRSTIGDTFQCSIFSDNVVIVSKDETDESFFEMVEYLSIITYRLLVEKNIAVRGALAFGRVTIITKDNDRIIAGRPLIEAYQFEQKLNWIGVLLCPSISHLHSRFKEYEFAKKQVRHSIMEYMLKFLRSLKTLNSVCRIESLELKGYEEGYAGFVIVPHDRNSISPVHIRDELDIYMEKLQELFLVAPNPDIQRKYTLAIQINRICMECMHQCQLNTYYNVVFLEDNILHVNKNNYLKILDKCY